MPFPGSSIHLFCRYCFIPSVSQLELSPFPASESWIIGTLEKITKVIVYRTLFSAGSSAGIKCYRYLHVLDLYDSGIQLALHILRLMRKGTRPAGLRTPKPNRGEPNFKACSVASTSTSNIAAIMAAVSSMMRLANRRPGQACCPPIIMVSVFRKQPVSGFWNNSKKKRKGRVTSIGNPSAVESFNGEFYISVRVWRGR